MTKKNSQKKETVKVTLHYTLHNNGDGSISAQFHEDEEGAKIASLSEEASGEAFCEGGPKKITLEFNKQGKLLNPTSTKEELLNTLADYHPAFSDQEIEKRVKKINPALKLPKP
jgi:hypothetical protein